MTSEIEIIFEDQHLIVLNKPVGLLSQEDHEKEENLVSLLREHFGRHYVGLVHRLDRNTSGIMVVAKRSKSAERLTKALQEGHLQREYLAFLWGKLTRPERWNHWLSKDSETNKVKAYLHKTAGTKEAVLKVTPVKSTSWKNQTLTLAHFILETGRSHQIRAQAAAQSYPVVGDIKYGKKETATLDKQFGRPALHSWKLEFPHPMSKEMMKFEASMPQDMKTLEKGK